MKTEEQKNGSCKYSRTNLEKRSDFEEAVKPLIKFLNDNYHPHTTVIVDCGKAQLVEGIMSMITEEFYRD